MHDQRLFDLLQPIRQEDSLPQQDLKQLLPQLLWLLFALALLLASLLISRL